MLYNSCWKPCALDSMRITFCVVAGRLEATQALLSMGLEYINAELYSY